MGCEERFCGLPRGIDPLSSAFGGGQLRHGCIGPVLEELQDGDYLLNSQGPERCGIRHMAREIQGPLADG